MPDNQKQFPLPKHNPEVVEFLSQRRSNLAKTMSVPGPSEDQIMQMLTIAARVPDHRKLAPWRFIQFEGKKRADFGQHIASVFMKDNPNAPLDRSIFEGQRLMRAPLVICVVSSPVDCVRGTPVWEQELSSGAVCFNLCLAAQALGFAAQWLTEWYAYDDIINSALGLSPSERVAGYIYIGTTEVLASQRTRPEISKKLKIWGK